MQLKFSWSEKPLPQPPQFRCPGHALFSCNLDTIGISRVKASLLNLSFSTVAKGHQILTRPILNYTICNAEAKQSQNEYILMSYRDAMGIAGCLSTIVSLSTKRPCVNLFVLTCHPSPVRKCEHFRLCVLDTIAPVDTNYNVPFSDTIFNIVHEPGFILHWFGWFFSVLGRFIK